LTVALVDGRIVSVPLAWYPRHAHGSPTVLKCPRCGGKLKIKALVIEARNIERLLPHLREPLEPPTRSPARDPPYFKSKVLRRKLGELN